MNVFSKNIFSTNNHRFQLLLNFFQWLLLASVLTACGSGGGGSSSAVSNVGINGAAVKGPVTSATITAYAVDSNGTRSGAPLGSVTTDANGNYSLSLNPDSAGTVLLVLTGGSYVDEATGNTIALGVGEELEAYTQMPTSGEITVTLNNVGSVEHNWIVLAAGTRIEDESQIPDDRTDFELVGSDAVPPGDSSTLTFTAPESGTYQIICDVPGHFSAGMEGRLRVDVSEG